ncbi:DUF1654 domain-containing protein [Azotobacter chroococcum]|uniref:DUF1654 domain-containing protein n=1 Tax=Azotobacter chroococcum TaxID=353 RepID=UPI000B609CD1|nr:hypothetical protein ACG10_07765 [Azotobacter chroococcum]
MSRSRARTVTHQTQISSYERLVRRVNQAITSPMAQARRQALLSPAADDRPDDWERLLDEIQESENVSMTQQRDGSVHLRWSRPEH